MIESLHVSISFVSHMRDECHVINTIPFLLTSQGTWYTEPNAPSYWNNDTFHTTITLFHNPFMLNGLALPHQ